MINQSQEDMALKHAISGASPPDLIALSTSQIAVRRWGTGPAVLCLHATGHASGDYEALAERLGASHEIFAIDWPGQGFSPDDGYRPDADHYADIVIEVTRALGLLRPIVIGNSLGRAAAIIAAAREPQLFSGLVLCNPGGLAPLDPVARVAIPGLVAFFKAGARRAKWFGPMFHAYYSFLVLPQSAAKAQRTRIIEAGYALAPLLAQAWEGFANPKADIRALTQHIQMPVWLAWSKQDRLIAWSRSKAAAQRFPNHRITLFEGGHSAFLEQTEAFTNGFLKFAISVRTSSVA